jgi:hypothetical protein
VEDVEVMEIRPQITVEDVEILEDRGLVTVEDVGMEKFGQITGGSGRLGSRRQVVARTQESRGCSARD